MTNLLTSLQFAKTKGIKRPKIKLGRFTFSLAPDDGRNPGSVYVNLGSEYMAKIDVQKRITNVKLTPEMLAEVEAILVDVQGAATAYGRKTGNCCICNRELTAKESIENCIGPICAEKFGFVMNRPGKKYFDMPADF